MSIDLGDLKSVAAFATEFRKRKLSLNLLINNAGIMACPYEKTVDGFESQFGVCHIGHLFLTTLLLDILIASKPSRVVRYRSIIATSSSSHFLDPPS
jgi:retinol dehydrogenase-12